MYRSPFNYDADIASAYSGLWCRDPSRAIQSQKEEADINTIVRRFGVTGQVPTNVRVPTYGDFEGIFDFQSAQNALIMAQQSFNAMPADVRSRFDNDPHRFVEFCTALSADGSSLKNLEEMRKIGLAVPAAPDPASAASS